MGITSEPRPTLEELWRLVHRQQEQVDAQAARIAALEASPVAAVQPSVLSEDDLEGELSGGDDLRVTRALLLRAAAVGAAGLAGASIVGLGASEPGSAEAAGAADARLGIAGSWIVSVAYASGGHRTRGLATFAPGGGFVGSISAYEHAPANPTPTRGTTLHGSWVQTGARAYAVTAVRLHLDQTGTLTGVMTTRIAATVSADDAAWDGTFTFDAAHPNGQVFKTGNGTLHSVRIGRHR